RGRHLPYALPLSVAARPGGYGDPHDLVRAAGGARHGRPRARDAPRAHHRRVPPRRGDARIDHARRHRRRRGGRVMFAAIRRVFPARETGLLLATVTLTAAPTPITPAFVFSHDGWRDLLLTPSILVLVAIGQAFVIITRSVDLSVGSVVGLTAYLTGRLFIDLPGI